MIADAGPGAGRALAVVNRMLKAMGVEARATIRSSGSGEGDPTVIDIQGEDAGLIIGRRGETLRALQFLVNIILSRQEEGSGTVVVDVEQYRERRQRQVSTLASRMAERAVVGGQPVTLDPMTPSDRRIVHVTLADNQAVVTESSGEGSQRRVTISPTGERPPSRPASVSCDRRPPPRRPAMRDDRD